MRFNENKYNRLHAMDLHDWSDEWIVDNNGNLVMREESYNDEIAMQTVRVELEE